MKKPAQKKVPRAVQELLPGVDTHQRASAEHAVKVDVSIMPKGACIGDGLVVRECPVCKRGAIGKKSDNGAWKFTHAGTIIVTQKSAKWFPGSHCRLNASGEVTRRAS